MGTVAELLKHVEIPRMLPIEQHFDSTHIPAEQVPEQVVRQLSRQEISCRFRPGMEIAITVGSRGIANIPEIIKAAADYLKERGAVPFLVPAMGSHGGATAQGQRSVIEAYGVTEECVGCQIRSSMETVEIGSTDDGRPVRIDKNAASADGILVVGRVKPHTGFRGPYESGIMKMMAIGLGKQYGAEMIHADGFGKLREYIPMYGKAILKHAPVLCGLAILENAYDQTRELVSLTPEEIVEKEPLLLERARGYMPRIRFESCDVLIVDRIGKNISGDGMDPNISGRFPAPYAQGGIDAQRVAVLDLTEESHGNACGIGLADVTTRRLFQKMDMEQTYPNAITNTLVGELKIPMVMDSDRLAIQLALKSCVGNDHSVPRVVRIGSTLEMQYIWVSEAMRAEAEADPDISVLGEAVPMAFDPKGNLF